MSSVLKFFLKKIRRLPAKKLRLASKIHAECAKAHKEAGGKRIQAASTIF